MPAFDFPNPPTPNQEVTNDATGVTYRYDAATQSWVIVTSQSASNISADLAQLKVDVGDLDERVETLEEAPADPQITYQIQTDKILRSSDPAIELVDSEGNFSNVKFEATGGLAVTSSASSIIFDGSGIDTDVDLGDYYTKTEVNDIIDGIGPAVNPDNYYTKAETDNTTDALQIQINDLAVTKGTASVYTLNDIGVIVGIRPGDFYIDNTVAKNISFITLSLVDNNGNDRPLGTTGDILELVGINNKHYRYKITTAAEGVAGVEFITAEDPDDLLIPGTTFQIFIYPQNSAAASVDYVDAGLATKLSTTGGTMSGNLTMNSAGIYTNNIIKSTRTSGYAFQVYDQENDNNPAFIHSNGNIRGAAATFTNSLEVRGSATFKSDLHLEANLSSTGNFNLEGNLSFTQGGTIIAASGNTVLSGRASLEIRTAADYPVVISSGSSYKRVLAIYGYDGNEDDNRGEVAYINAKGEAFFSTVYSNDEELATQTYVDDMGQIHYGNIVPSGSDVNDGDLWVDSGNMRLLMRASGAWVNPDREADTDSFKANANPNGRKFGFSSGTAAVTGKLNYYDSGGLKLRLSNTDAFGIKWNDGGITQDVTMSSGPYFTITEVVNDTNHKIIRQGRVSRIDYHAGDILCHLSSHITNGGFSTSKQYWVNIGGII